MVVDFCRTFATVEYNNYIVGMITLIFDYLFLVINDFPLFIILSTYVDVRARSLVVSDLPSRKKDSRFEKLSAAASYVQRWALSRNHPVNV